MLLHVAEMCLLDPAGGVTEQRIEGECRVEGYMQERSPAMRRRRRRRSGAMVTGGGIGKGG